MCGMPTLSSPGLPGMMMTVATRATGGNQTRPRLCGRVAGQIGVMMGMAHLEAADGSGPGSAESSDRRQNGLFDELLKKERCCCWGGVGLGLDMNKEVRTVSCLAKK